MRAVLVKNGAGAAEDMYIGEVETPVPRADEVLVKIKAFGLNRMDIIQRNGNYPPPAGSSTILGVEFAGHIAAVGSDVSQWKINDEVMGLAGGGAYAEYIVVLQTHVLFKLWLFTGRFDPNEDVLVHAGASGIHLYILHPPLSHCDSGVGIAAIQLARFNGAISSTGSSPCPNGATNTANYKTEDFSQVAKQVTGNKGVDVVIDFVGQSHFEKNLASLAVDGRMTMLALLSGPTAASINLAPILYKRLRIQGSTLRSRTPAYQAGLIARFEKEVLQHITGEKGDGPIKTYIHKVYSWNDIQDAHREMESNTTSGKIIAEVY
ncbi:chaperonin 10-like protein [Mycena latifolia]|nr:chaperonin 10-like protein [Mycena latifolia]